MASDIDLSIISSTASNFSTRNITSTRYWAKHQDLIFDLDSYLRKSTTSFNEILSQMEIDYENKGFIKRNPNRRASAPSKVSFLKYECILWRSLGLLKGSQNNYYVDWKLITSICGLPDL